MVKYVDLQEIVLNLFHNVSKTKKSLTVKIIYRYLVYVQLSLAAAIVKKQYAN